MTTRKAKKMLESIKEFGDIPRYVVEIHRGKLYVWKNNGQIPTTKNLNKIEEFSASGGFATFVGMYSPDDAREYIENLGFLP